MATVSERIGVVSNVSGVAQVEVDFDDVTLNLIALRVINTLQQDILVRADHPQTGRTFSVRFSPGTTTIPVPVQAQMAFTRDAKNRLDTIGFTIMHPAP